MAGLGAADLMRADERVVGGAREVGQEAQSLNLCVLQVLERQAQLSRQRLRLWT